VRTVLKRLAVAFLTAGIWICVPAASAQALADSQSVAWVPCEEGNEIACGHVTVPLDPSGAVTGTITLALHRHRASVGDERSAIISLAGGPGQSALPFTESFDELLGPIAATRDLIVFDQRGIGLSHPLSCHAFEQPRLSHSYGQLIETCASQLGPTRSFYTTADTVADIEAVRQAGGYEKLVLYGTSYGTKVAEMYAQAYPSHVEALVLDSVVPPNGPDALNRPTFAAVPRILRQICAAHACARTTANPVADLSRVIALMGGEALQGTVIDGFGKAHKQTINTDELFEMFLAGDFSAVLRAELVTALAAAARADTAPIERLVTLFDSGEVEAEDFNSPLYFATSCEEQDFPWNRSASATARIAQAKEAANALPASAFAPFTASTALEEGDIQACAYWPSSPPSPPLDETPLPNVPTLILSGTNDLRTPTANAQEVAAQIPDSHLLVVPYAGHSVLTNEPTSCAREALLAMFASGSIKPCHATSPPAALQPPPLPPLSIRLVPPAHDYHGVPGRTLDAVGLTLSDGLRHILLQLISSASSERLSLPTIRIGGLRAGWAEYSGGTFSFHDYSYIPGVTISGTVKSEAASLRVGGSDDAHGTLHLGPKHALVGTLGGSHMVLAASSIASAAIVGGDAEASTHSAAGDPSALTGARELSRILGWVQP